MEQFKQKLSSILNKNITLTFSGRSFSVVIRDIKQARLADVINKPERRQNVDGTFYTPTVVILDCGNEQIHIYLEDIERVVQQLHGIRIRMIDGQEIDFICQSTS